MLGALFTNKLNLFKDNKLTYSLIEGALTSQVATCRTNAEASSQHWGGRGWVVASLKLSLLHSKFHPGKAT